MYFLFINKKLLSNDGPPIHAEHSLHSNVAVSMTVLLVADRMQDSS